MFLNLVETFLQICFCNPFRCGKQRNICENRESGEYFDFATLFLSLPKNLAGKKLVPLSARAQYTFCWPAHAYLLRKQWRFKYFKTRKWQTLEGFFSQLCSCFVWGATDSDKLSFYLLIDVKIM